MPALLTAATRGGKSGLEEEKQELVRQIPHEGGQMVARQLVLATGLPRLLP